MHLNLISEMQSREGVRLRLLGETLDGHDIDQLQIGEQVQDWDWHCMVMDRKQVITECCPCAVDQILSLVIFLVQASFVC